MNFLDWQDHRAALGISGEKKSDRVFLILLGLYFLGLYLQALEWNRLGYFSNYDILFDADPNTNIRTFIFGWEGGRRTAVHSLLEYFSLPVSGVGKALAWFHSGVSVDEAKKLVALAISPLAATGSVWVFRSLLSRLKLDTATQYAGTVLYASSFSMLLFGSVPETYAISGLLINILLLWALDPEGVRRHDASWLVLGVLVAGVTITNVAVFFLAYVFYLHHSREWSVHRTVARAGMYSIAGVCVALSLYWIGVVVTSSPAGGEMSLGWVAKYSAFDLYKIFSTSVNHFANLLTAFSPLSPDFSGGRVSMFRNRDDVGVIVGSLIATTSFFWLVFRKVGSIKGTPYPLLLSIIGFNALLHSFFGYEQFLYSQHWVAVLIVLFVLAFRQSPIKILAVAGFLSVVNIYFLMNIASNINYIAIK